MLERLAVCGRRFLTRRKIDEVWGVGAAAPSCLVLPCGADGMIFLPFFFPLTKIAVSRISLNARAQRTVDAATLFHHRTFHVKGSKCTLMI